MKKKHIICGLDVGASKICMIIAREHRDGTTELLGSGYTEAAGLNRGVVVDLDEAAAAIRKAAEEAERQAGVPVDTVRLGAGGDHFQSCNAHGTMQLTGDPPEVAPETVAHVMRTAQAIALPPERDVVHVLPQEFFLDGRGGIQNPIGLFGSRLDVNVHIVTCQTALNQNLINAVNRAEMRVQKIILQPLAAAEAVLTNDERELGVVMIDIGGGNTSIAVFQNNAVQLTRMLPVGGLSFTRDLAIGLQTPVAEAENIKKSMGTVLTDKVGEDETITVPGMGGRASRTESRKLICDIMRARAQELIELIGEQLKEEMGVRQPIAGVVITGGGSMLDGMPELAEDILNMPTRRGLPHGFTGISGDLLHPGYAVAIGLTLFKASDVMTPVANKGLQDLLKRFFVGR